MTFSANAKITQTKVSTSLSSNIGYFKGKKSLNLQQSLPCQQGLIFWPPAVFLNSTDNNFIIDICTVISIDVLFGCYKYFVVNLSAKNSSI
jgi:hypothetical protein